MRLLTFHFSLSLFPVCFLAFSLRSCVCSFSSNFPTVSHWPWPFVHQCRIISPSLSHLSQHSHLPRSHTHTIAFRCVHLFLFVDQLFIGKFIFSNGCCSIFCSFSLLSFECMVHQFWFWFIVCAMSNKQCLRKLVYVCTFIFSSSSLFVLLFCCCCCCYKCGFVCVCNVRWLLAMMHIQMGWKDIQKTFSNTDTFTHTIVLLSCIYAQRFEH